MVERDLERRLKVLVKLAGGTAHKLDARAHKGAPDRIVTINGKTVYVELKTETGRLSPLQQLELEKIQAAGGVTRVIYGMKALEAFIDAA